jgi:dUTP pyrophosphatase
MKLKIKKLLVDAKIPEYSREGDAGLDLTATSRFYDDYGNICYGTGIAIKVPDGYEGQIRPRSSISKYELILCNSLGTIDSNYTGELICKFKIVKGGHSKVNKEIVYEVGDKVAQLLIKPCPKIEFEEVEELEVTNRGDLGFGSTELLKTKYFSKNVTKENTVNFKNY